MKMEEQKVINPYRNPKKLLMKYSLEKNKEETKDERSWGPSRRAWTGPSSSFSFLSLSLFATQVAATKNQQ